MELAVVLAVVATLVMSAATHRLSRSNRGQRLELFSRPARTGPLYAVLTFVAIVCTSLAMTRFGDTGRSSEEAALLAGSGPILAPLVVMLLHNRRVRQQDRTSR